MKAPGFWYRPPRLKARLLSPLSVVYGVATRLRLRWTKPRRVAVPVVCIGNLVVGGAGKTPIAISVARRLAAQGRSPQFLTRGYGGRLPGPLAVDLARHDARAVGDEAMLLAAHFTTWVGGNRVASAEAAVRDGADVLVMDDGFQNPALHKDVSLIAIDGGAGLGNGRVFPAGPLRETSSDGLARADAVVLIGEDSSGIGGHLEYLPARGGKPILRARLEPEPGSSDIRGQSVVAFAGIGRPGKFFATLERMGARLVARFSFPDHHVFDPDELMQMAELADEADAVLVTTAKDYARLPDAARPMVQVIAVKVVWEDPSALDSVLAPAARPR